MALKLALKDKQDSEGRDVESLSGKGGQHRPRHGGPGSLGQLGRRGAQGSIDQGSMGSLET